MRAFGIAVLVLALSAGTAAQAQKRGGGDPQKESMGYVKPVEKREKTFPTKVSWVATSLNGKPFSGERPTFVVDERFRINGFAGCNTFSTVAYPLREQRFAVGPLALTKKPCEKAIAESEQQFLITLRHSVQWDTVVGDLVLKSVVNGQPRELKFSPAL